MGLADDWVRRYVIAWQSNDPESIESLFTISAIYEYEPSAPPLIGRAAIVESWINHPDPPGTWTFEWETFIERPGLAIVKGCTEYFGRASFDNLWVIQLDDQGRATRFSEWFMKRPHQRDGKEAQ